MVFYCAIVFYLPNRDFFPSNYLRADTYIYTKLWAGLKIPLFLSLFNKSTKNCIFLNLFQDVSIEIGTKSIIVLKMCNNYNYHHSGVSFIWWIRILFATKNQEILFNDFFSYYIYFIVPKHLLVVHRVSLYKEVYCDG